MNFSEAIAQTLAAHGVRHAFGLMGSGNMRVIHHMAEDHAIAFHPARHEAGAVAAADGFARATGELGVCLVTQGPGLTNAITPLVTARRARTPLLLLTGDCSGVVRRDDPFASVQSYPQSTLLSTADVPMNRARPATVELDVARSVAAAVHGSTPVGLAMPAEYETSECGPLRGTVEQAPPAPLAPDASAVRDAAARLRDAKRPVVLAGIGAVRSGAGDALRRVAGELGAVLCTSLRASGLFGDDPYNAGVAGGFAPPGVRAVLDRADCVLVVGASLNGYTTAKDSLFTQAEIVHCTDDPAAAHGPAAPAERLLGDARLTAEALWQALVELGGPPSGFRRDPDVVDALGAPAHEPFEDVSGGGVTDPRALCARLDGLLPHDRTVVVDGGHFSHFVVRHIGISARDTLLYMLDFGAVGGGMGAAIGAAIGRPDRFTVLFIGDGGFFMTMGDLDLAVRERLPLLVICLNDRAYGAEVALLRGAGFDPAAATFATPELADIARAMGCDALTVTSLDQLGQLPERIGTDLAGPLFIDCHISRDVSSGLIGPR